MLQAYVDAWNRHDSLAFDTLLAPAGIHEDLAWGFRGEGPAAVRAFMRDVIAVSPDYHWEVTLFLHGRAKRSSGVDVDGHLHRSQPGWAGERQRITGRGAAVARIANGKIVRLSDYYDVASFFPKQLPDTARK